jgi:hypothetical protein
MAIGGGQGRLHTPVFRPYPTTKVAPDSCGIFSVRPPTVLPKVAGIGIGAVPRLYGIGFDSQFSDDFEVGTDFRLDMPPHFDSPLWRRTDSRQPP